MRESMDSEGHHGTQDAPLGSAEPHSFGWIGSWSISIRDEMGTAATGEFHIENLTDFISLFFLEQAMNILLWSQFKNPVGEIN